MAEISPGPTSADYSTVTRLHGTALFGDQTTSVLFLPGLSYPAPSLPHSLTPSLLIAFFPTFYISVFFFFLKKSSPPPIFPGVRIFISAFSQSTALTIFRPDPTHVFLSIFSAWLHIEL